MTSHVHYPTREELLQRREKVLAKVRLSREELEAAIESGYPTYEQDWAWDNIVGIEHLLRGFDDDEPR